MIFGITATFMVILKLLFRKQVCTKSRSYSGSSKSGGSPGGMLFSGFVREYVNLCLSHCVICNADSVVSLPSSSL